MLCWQTHAGSLEMPNLVIEKTQSSIPQLSSALSSFHLDIFPREWAHDFWNRPRSVRKLKNCTLIVNQEECVPIHRVQNWKSLQHIVVSLLLLLPPLLPRSDWAKFHEVLSQRRYGLKEQRVFRKSIMESLPNYTTHWFKNSRIPRHLLDSCKNGATKKLLDIGAMSGLRYLRTIALLLSATILSKVFSTWESKMRFVMNAFINRSELENHLRVYDNLRCKQDQAKAEKRRLSREASLKRFSAAKRRRQLVRKQALICMLASN